MMRPASAPMARLDDVRRRLELVLAATYGPLRIEAAEAPRVPGVLRRLAARMPAHLRPRGALPSAAGERVLLPASLALPPADAVARFRVLALEQGERLARGTALHAPPRDQPLERDLYLLAEGAAVDRALAVRARNAGPALARARAEALRERPSLMRLTPTEREVERLVRAALAAAPDAPPAELPADGGPDASLHWAREAAARVRAAVPTIGGYRGVTPVALWGTVPDAVARPSGGQGLVQEDASPGEGGERGPEPPPAPNDGAAGDANDDATARGERPTPAPGSDADAAGDGGRAVPPSVTLDPVDAASRVVDDPFAQRREQADVERGTTYPEWDCWAGTYRREGARVVDRAAAEGNGEWAARVLREHASLARTVRHRFERLRARRARLGRQRDGEELDLDACVRALVERRAGGTPGDDLYVCVRPARRALAVALLVDASGSTDAPVAGERRVIDVEREAVLLAAEALDALGDPYTVLSFSGRGARGVGVTALKTFGEHTRGALARRVGEVAPASNTRLGAAVRHAASLLARQPAGHRLLLLLSDGKPNDADGYVDRYAVEDSRRAVQEARASGIVTHCLTVDQEEPEYLAHVFGAAGYTILRRPEALPTALVGVVRQLLGRGA